MMQHSDYHFSAGILIAMEDWEAFITYLLVKNITSSEQLIRWIPMVYEVLGRQSSIVTFFPQFMHAVREISRNGTVSAHVLEYTLQLPLWYEDALLLLREFKNMGIKVILWNSTLMPESLKNIPDPPIILYAIGNASLLEKKPHITIVGTRVPSCWGREKATQLAHEAAGCYVITVSGKAQGTDTIIFTETLAAKGQTVAIVPFLSEEQLTWKESDDVLICSENPLFSHPSEKWRYIARNRLLAAFTAETIIVEAPLQSGTLHTERFAYTYDRDVFYVLPGPILDSQYGGIVAANAMGWGNYIQSLYDVFWCLGKRDSIMQYYNLVSKTSNGKICVKPQDFRYLGTIDLLKNGYIKAKDVVELQQLGLIRTRKNSAVINFSSSTLWQKIS